MARGVPTAPARNSIWSVLPADGTRTATVGSGDFGTSPLCLGSSRASRCLPVSDEVVSRTQSTMAGLRIKRAEHVPGVAPLVNWLRGRSSEVLRVQSSRSQPRRRRRQGRPQGGADVLTADLANGRFITICVEHRSISATHAPGRRRPRCAPACRRTGMSMFTAEQYRAKAAEFRALLTDRLRSPNETKELRDLEQSYTTLAENEEWMAVNSIT